MEKLYTVSKKQDQELTVAQIMHPPSYGYVYNFCCLLKNSGKNKEGNCHQQLGNNQSLNISFTNSLFYQIIIHTFQSWL